MVIRRFGLLLGKVFQGLLSVFALAEVSTQIAR
jgi:hypothetical protein